MACALEEVEISVAECREIAREIVQQVADRSGADAANDEGFLITPTDLEDIAVRVLFYWLGDEKESR